MRRCSPWPGAGTCSRRGGRRAAATAPPTTCRWSGPCGHAEPPIGKASRLLLRRGDLVRLVTGSGGGYGDPRERDRALVRADLRDELITAAEAEEVYGVAPGEGVEGAAGPGEEVYRGSAG